MKTIILAGVLTSAIQFQTALSAADSGLAEEAVATTAAPSFSVVVRDAHSTVWERVEYQATPDGQKVAITNQYTELANGLNFTNSTGEYVESKELIEILPEGGAAALHGQFRAWFPADISEGVIEVLTPDGMNLKSRPAAISYFNGTDSVLIAELKSSLGQLLPSGNQVIWTNCFTDVAADLVVTYRKGGIECDLVFRENPPGPEQWNLGPDTRLQLLTEFFDTQEPVKEIGEAHPQSGLRDTTLRFGSVMTMTVGKAFSVGDAAVDEGTAVEPDETQVYKSWEILSDPQDPKVQRTFLIEEVPYERVEQKLKDLPTRTAKLSSPPLEGSGVGSALHRVTPGRVLPPQRLAKQGGKKMELAQANVSSKAGYVLDWVINLSSGTTYALRGDTTFYLSAPVTFSGVVIFEPGSVLKYASGASLAVGGINWQASAYRPVVFTSKNDNSVGETVSGSTGDPSGNCYANPALQLPYGSAALSHFRIAHAQQAVQFSSAGVTLAHGQIVNCQNGVTPANASLSLKNVLFANVNTALSGLQYSSVSAENVTFAGSVNYPMTFSALASGSGPYGISLKNCILTRLSTFLSGAPPLNISGSHNGFYNTPAAPAALTSSFSPTGNPFQTVGAGNYYLTDTGFRDVGTPEINAGLLADLKKRTTYPPQDRANLTISASETWPVQAQRDNDGLIDLGFHYAPLDYMVRAVNVNSGSATLTLGEGVAVASYGHEGFITDYGAKFVSRGTAQTHNQLCFYQAVQEQPVKLNNVATYTILRWHGYQPPSRLDARFTDFNGMAGSMIAFGFSFQCNLRDCLIGSGRLSPEGAGDSYPDGFTNNIIESATLEIGTFDYICPVYFYNNTVRNSTVSFHDDWGVNGFRTVRDNLFDNSTLWVPYPTLVNYDHNAYRLSTTALTPAHTGDLTLSALTYATGPLGNCYISSSTPTIIDAGSRPASAAGLYHHTIKTDQTKEAASQVDIGFHSVALDSSGNPADTDQDGVPDYAEDKNGNGTTDPGESSWRPTVWIEAENPNASEIGNTSGKFRIFRSGDNENIPLIVHFQMSGNATLGVDYFVDEAVQSGGQVVIPEQSPIVDVAIRPLKDFVTEGNETVTFTVMEDPNYVIGVPSSATVTISDNPTPSPHSVTIQAADAVACEDIQGEAAFAVWRTDGELAAPLTVYFNVSGVATEAADYQTLPRQITIPTGGNSANIPVHPIADAVEEPGETISLTLQPGANYTIGNPNNASVSIVDSCSGSDSTGTDFWLLFPKAAGVTPFSLKVLISSPYVTTGTISIPGLNYERTFSVAPGATTVVDDIPPEAMLNSYGIIQSNGVHVITAKPVSVYGLNIEYAASEGFTAFPASMLGNDYYVLARAGAGPPQLDTRSQFAIVATEDNTSITIIPSSTASIEGGVVLPRNLNRGETYQLRSSGWIHDMTGTRVQADKPIVVFAGAEGSRVPNNNYSAANPLMEQLLPVASWGRQAVAMSFAGRNGDSYRILAAYDNTLVAINGSVGAVLQAGQFHDAIVSGPVEFRANNPIQVAQFANSYTFDNAGGDPTMILVPPTGNYLTACTILIPSDFYYNYLNVIAEKSALGSTFIDGEQVPQNLFQKIGNSSYYGAQVPKPPGTHVVSSSSPVGVQVYGFWLAPVLPGGPTRYDAYGYVGGIADPGITAVPDNFNIPLDGAKTLDVLANDRLLDRDVITIEITGLPSDGHVDLISNTKNIRYTADTGYSGSDEFSYTISVGAHSSSATVSLMVNPPVAQNDEAMLCGGGGIVIPVLQNDSTPSSGLKVTSAGGAKFGSVRVNENNTDVTYNRFVNAGNAPDSFSYVVTDDRDASASAMVRVYVLAAAEDHVNVFDGETITVHVLDNDGGTPNATLEAITQGSLGNVEISADGRTLTYESFSDTGYADSDQFTYTVVDGDCTQIGTVYVTINFIPVLITTQPQTQTVLAGNDATFTVAATGSWQLSYQWYHENGTALTSGSTTPGGATISGAETDTLTLGGVQPSDFGHRYYVKVSNPASVDGIESDKAALFVADEVPPVIAAQPVSRNAQIGGNAQFSVSVLSAPPTTYQWYKGTQLLTGKTDATLLLQNVQSTDAGTYSVVVHNDFGNTTSEGAVLAVITPPLPPVTFTPNRSATLPVTVKLAVLGHPDAVIRYTLNGTTPNGSSSEYLNPIPISSKTTISAFATKPNYDPSGFTVATMGDPVAPTAITDIFSFEQNETEKLLDVLANDANPDQDALSITIMQQPANGTATAGTSGITYQPNPNFFGMDMFTYKITDSHGNVSAAPVAVFVNKSDNNRPIAGATPLQRFETYIVTLPAAQLSCTISLNDLRAMASDYDDDFLIIHSIASPTKGTLSQGSGQITYTRTSGKYGTDSFQYVITDGNGGHDIGTIVIHQADTDSDGMPNDWEIAKSLSTTVDDSSADPDSDGLPNLAEYAIRTNPHSADNPLNLSALSTTTGFIDVPLNISPDVDPDATFLVHLDGEPMNLGELADVVFGADGSWHLQLNAETFANGSHTLRLGISYAKDLISEPLTVLGSVAALEVDNPFTLDVSSAVYDGILVIEGTVHVPANSYEIEVYDRHNNWLTTLIGTPSEGRISTPPWDATGSAGPLRCEFALTWSSGGGGPSPQSSGGSASGTAVIKPKDCKCGKDVTRLLYQTFADISETYAAADSSKKFWAEYWMFRYYLEVMNAFAGGPEWDINWLHENSAQVYQTTQLGCPECERTVMFDGACVNGDELNYTMYGLAMVICGEGEIKLDHLRNGLFSRAFWYEMLGDPFDSPDTIRRKVRFARYGWDLNRGAYISSVFSPLSSLTWPCSTNTTRAVADKHDWHWEGLTTRPQ